MQTFRFLIYMLVWAGISSLQVSSAQAALGEVFSPETVKRAEPAAAIRVQSQGNYTVSEYTEVSGTVVREYVGPDNKVFAVVWQGPRMPDLNQIYGQYYDRYNSAATRTRPRSRHFSMQESDLVVNTNGKAGSFSGVAYLPGEMPPGVTEADLQ